MDAARLAFKIEELLLTHMKSLTSEKEWQKSSNDEANKILEAWLGSAAANVATCLRDFVVEEAIGNRAIAMNHLEAAKTLLKQDGFNLTVGIIKTGVD